MTTTKIGYGYSFKGNNLTEIELADNDRKRHFWCFGTTGVGKTRLMELMVEQDIRKGYNVFIIDPKNDIEFFSKVVQIAIETGRTDDLRLMTPIFPHLSCKLNPLEYFYMTEELIAHILSGVEMGKEPFFYNVANESSTAIVQSLMYIINKRAEEKRLNFEDIKDKVSAEGFQTLQKQIEEYKNTDIVAMKLFLDLDKIVKTGQDYYSKISSSLRVALMELTTGNTGTILGCARGNDVIYRLENKKGLIFLAQVGSLLTSRTAFTVSKILVSMLKSLAGRYYASSRVLKPFLCLYLDEAQNVLYHGFEDLVAKVGSANFMVHGFTQSVNQIYSAMGDINKGRSIIDNINTKIFMRAPDVETADYAATHFGQERRLDPILSISGSPTLRENQQDRINKDHILSLQPMQFFMRTYSGLYRGKTSRVENAMLDIKYPTTSI